MLVLVALDFSLGILGIVFLSALLFINGGRKNLNLAKKAQKDYLEITEKYIQKTEQSVTEINSFHMYNFNKKMCPKCNNSIKNDMKFCPICGNRL